MADELSCWLAVIGLPSAKSDAQIGPGKSCLCNRFIRGAKEDDYTESHPSSISNQDFGGSVVNNDNFLYWGSVRKSIENLTYVFKVIEQTQFYDDTSFKPFGSSEPYEKRAIKTKVTTHGTKYQYIDYDQIADQCLYEDVEMFSTDNKVTVDAFIYVFDVSQDDINFVTQYNMVETFIKNANKPLVIALSKFDDLKGKHLETLRNLTTRKKVPVIEVSSRENINVEFVFFVAAKIAKHGSKFVAKIAIPQYEECFNALKEKREEITRLFNQLTERSVVHKNVTWFEFQKFSKENKHFQDYCEHFGSRKAKSSFERHIRNLTIKFLEKRKNLYLKDLDVVFVHFINNLTLSDHKNAIQFIRNHQDFNDYFVALSFDATWKTSELQHLPDNRLLIPLDLLNESEAIICFDQRIEELQKEQEQVDLADEFERDLSHTNNIIPGLSLDDVLSAVDIKYSKLDRNKSQSIYNDHQIVLSKQMIEDFKEMLMENTELFKKQIPSGELHWNAKEVLSGSLKDDVRWKNLCCMENERDCLLLKHLSVFVAGIRINHELTSVEKSYKSMILEKPLGRKELNYSTKLTIDDEHFNIIMMSNDRTAKTWSEYIKTNLESVSVDDTSYKLNMSTQHPDILEITSDFPIHLIMGFYHTDNWDSFRSVTRCYDKLLNRTGYQGVPCQLVYLPSANPTVTKEEGSRFAHRLNCDLVSEEGLKDCLHDIISNNVTLLQHRAEFIAAPSNSFNKTVLNISIRLLYDDDISIKDIISSLFKYQFCFVHPYEPGVYVIHTLLGSLSAFVMIHLLHYLDKEGYTEHGCVLVCKDSRRASLENARCYMMDYSKTKSLGVVCIQTSGSLDHATVVMETASGLGIEYVMLEQETGSRRASVGTQTTLVDMVIHTVLLNSVQYLSASDHMTMSRDLSCDESSDDVEFDLSNRHEIDRKIAYLKDKIRRNTLLESRPGFSSPPPHLARLPDKTNSLSVSWNDLRGDSSLNNHWYTIPRSSKTSLDKTPPTPVYATVLPKARRGSGSIVDEHPNTPKSPLPPPRPYEFSETSSEGLDTADSDRFNKSRDSTTVAESPFKTKKSTPSRFQKKKQSDEELELKRLEKQSSKLKKQEEKEAKKKAKEMSKKYKNDKNKKLMATWEKKHTDQLAGVKSYRPDYMMQDSCYYGQPMEEIAPWGGVPFYISTCVDYLECHDLTIEGLYRKEGNKLQIIHLENTFELAYTNKKLSEFNIVELDVSVHVVASSIKKFFKRLPTPLIPQEFHNLLLAAVEIDTLNPECDINHSTMSIAKILEILNTFPRSNKITLAYIIRHLDRIAQLKDHNKMSSSNLAIILWPTLLQPAQEVLINTEDRTKFSGMTQFLIDNSDGLFGPELPDTLPPDDEDIYDAIFHPELTRQKTQAEYEYIRRPKTYFNQMLRIGHVPSLVKQCVTFIDNGKITTSLYVYTARDDLVDNFVKAYEAAYAVDEHRGLNFRKVLKNLSITRSATDESISTSTTDDNSVSSLSGDLSTSDSRFGAFEEQTMDTTIVASVLKRYLAGLRVPVIPPEQHQEFLGVLNVEGEERTIRIKAVMEGLKQSHKLLLSHILKHLNLMKDKGVLQIDEVYSAILFFGDTPATPSDTSLTPSDTSVTPSDTLHDPELTRYHHVINVLIESVNVLAMDYNTSLYAPLYEALVQDTHNTTHHYHLPVLPEETRIYDTPSDTIFYAEPFYSAVSNVYQSAPHRHSLPNFPAVEPAYADPDDLSELYDNEEDLSSNTYVDSIPLPVSSRHETSNSDNFPNR